MRDCENCIYARPFGGENDNRCTAWDCDYIPRKDAIELWKKTREEQKPQSLLEAYMKMMEEQTDEDKND